MDPRRIIRNVTRFLELSPPDLRDLSNPILKVIPQVVERWRSFIPNPSWDRLSPLWRREAPRSTQEATIPAGLGALGLFLGISVLLHGVGIWAVKKKVEASAIPGQDSGFAPRELIALSQGVLEKWKIDPSYKIPYLNYFLSLESSNESEQKAKSQRFVPFLASALVQAEQTPDHMGRITGLATAAYWNFTMRYGRGRDQISHYQDPGKGNCVAQTKLLISIMERVVSLPADEGFGVEVYGHHVAPVHYKRNAEGKVTSVLNLVTGNVTTKVVAPIYKAPILLVAYIEGHGEKSPVKAEELLVEAPLAENIAKAPINKQREDLASGSWRFPHSEAEYDGDSPEDALLPPPKFEVSLGGQPSAGKNEGAGKGKGIGSVMASFEELPPIERKMVDRAGFYFYQTITVSDIESEIESGIRTPPRLLWSFRRPQDQAYFQSLNSEKERYGLMKGLTQLTMQEQPPTPTALEIFTHPQASLRQRSLIEFSEVRETSTRLMIYQQQLRQVGMLLGREEEGISEDWQEMIKANPAWQNYLKARETFAKSFAEDPKNFLLLMDQETSWEKRKEMLFLVGDSERGFNEKLRRVLADPAEVQVGIPGPQDSTYRPLPSEWTVYDFETTDLATTSKASAPSSGQDTATSAPGKVLISGDLMAQMILSLEHRGASPSDLVLRWQEEWGANLAGKGDSNVIRHMFFDFAGNLAKKRAQAAGANFHGYSRAELLASPYLSPQMKNQIRNMRE